MPNYPAHLLAKAVTQPKKLTADEIYQITTSFAEWRRACDGFESRLYAVTHERDRLKAENEFMVRLFNIKRGEFDVPQCSEI